MVKRSRSKNSKKSLTNSVDTLEHKGSSIKQSRSGAKGKRAGKNPAHGKRAANKKTNVKKTKRTGRKAGGRKTGGRKGAHQEENSQTQAHETVDHSTE